MPLGLDINPAYGGNASGMQAQQMCTNMSSLLVKINARSHDGQPAGEFSGFMYSKSTKAIVTTGHIVGNRGPAGTGPPAEVFTVRYWDGFEENAAVLDRAPNNVPDLAILGGSRCGPRSLVGNGCHAGDTVYALGFSPHSAELICSKGVVSSGMMDYIAINAHVDNGYSGGPVVNDRGQLLGIIKGPMGSIDMPVGIIPAADLHTYLLQCGKPGLMH